MSGPPVGFEFLSDGDEFVSNGSLRHESGVVMGEWNGPAKRRHTELADVYGRRIVAAKVVLFLMCSEFSLVGWLLLHGQPGWMWGLLAQSAVGIWAAPRIGTIGGNETSEYDLALFEDRDDSECCLVALEIWRGADLVGIDRGVCWFEDNCVMFSGHGCSFVVGGQDVIGAKMLRVYLAIGPYVDRKETALPLIHPEAKFWISLVPVDSGRHVSWRANRKFQQSFAKFRAETPKSSRARQYPPDHKIS